jgi:hypothetical protein
MGFCLVKVNVNNYRYHQKKSAKEFGVLVAAGIAGTDPYLILSRSSFLREGSIL